MFPSPKVNSDFNANPCMNGGRCVNSDYRYQCECLEGFEGSHCEIGKNLEYFLPSLVRLIYIFFMIRDKINTTATHCGMSQPINSRMLYQQSSTASQTRAKTGEVVMRRGMSTAVLAPKISRAKIVWSFLLTDWPLMLELVCFDYCFISLPLFISYG